MLKKSKGLCTVLGHFLAFLFQLSLQDEGGADGGCGAKSSALAYSSD